MNVKLFKLENGEKVFKDFGTANNVELYGRQGYICEPVTSNAGDVIFRTKMSPSPKRIISI